MNVFLSPLGGSGAQFFDNNGKPLSGGKLYSYEAGTTEPCATYTDNTGNTPHANPIVLDSAGRIPGGEVWLEYQTSYKFVLAAGNDAVIASWDNIASRVDSADDADTAGDADTLDGIHWIGTSPVTGIKNYIDGGFALKPLVLSQAMNWTDKGFNNSQSSANYLDLGLAVGTRFLLNVNAVIQVSTGASASSIILQLEVADTPDFAGSNLLVPALGQVTIPAGSAYYVTLSPNILVVRDDSPYKIKRYVRLYVSCSDAGASAKTINNVQALSAVQLMY